MRDLHLLDGTAQAALVRSGEVAPIDLVAAAIDRIERIDPSVGAVVIRRFDEALDEARTIDGDATFRGVSMLLKDAGQELAEEPHWVGLAALRDAGHRSRHTTALAQRFRGAGLVTVGRSACPPFSAGVNTAPPGFAPTRKPWSPELTVGGSSGGSAAAVAAGLVPIAHGSDATGSLRFPAAYCGVLTLKPTRGMVAAVVPCSTAAMRGSGFAWTEFVITKSVRDLVSCWPIVASHPLVPPPGAAPIRVVLQTDDVLAGLPVEANVVAAIQRVGVALAELGGAVELGHPPGLSALLDPGFRPANAVIVEHARRSAIDWLVARLGRPPEAGEVESATLEAAERGRRHEESAVDAAIDLHVAIGDRIAASFGMPGRSTVLVCPVTHQGPFPLWQAEPFGVGVFCAPWSFSGQPAMAVPVGVRADGTPVSVQLVGERGADALLLDLAARLEQRGVISVQVGP